MSNTFLKFIRLTKVDAGKREVYGVVTSEVPDKDSEICDYDTTVPYYKAWSAEFEKATEGKSLGNIREMHGNSAAGKVTALEFDDAAREIRIVGRIVDDEAWRKCEEGVYTGFSQGGEYVKIWADGELKRYTARPSEVSLVDNPCNPEAHFEYVKADGTVELRKFSPHPDPIPNSSTSDTSFAGGDSCPAATSPQTADADPAAPPANDSRTEDDKLRKSSETLSVLEALKKCHDEIGMCHRAMAEYIGKLFGETSSDAGSDELSGATVVSNLTKALDAKDAELARLTAEHQQTVQALEQIHAELKAMMAEPRPPKGYARAVAITKDQDAAADGKPAHREGLELLKAIHRGEA